MPKKKMRQKNALLNNLGSKHHLVMKFGQFMSHKKRKKKLSKYSIKNIAWKLVIDSFVLIQIFAKPYWKMKSSQ